METVSRRERFAWAMYDFANSGYTTVVSTTIFNAYFVSVIAGGLREGLSTFLWTLSFGTSNLLVLLSAPVVGAIADAYAIKKRLLLVTSICCILATAALGLTGPDDIALAMIIVILAHLMFASGENLIAAFLPELVASERMGRLSGYGWSLGYIGGVSTLAVCLFFISWATNQGWQESQYVPGTLVLTAVIFGAAAAPTFFWLRERARPQPRSSSPIRSGFQRVRQTLSRMHRYQDLFRFLIAIMVFQAAVSSVVALAAVYAREVFAYETKELIQLIMIVNVTAAAGALFMGHLQDRIGSIAALSLSLLVWIAAIAGVYLAQTRLHILFAGFAIGAAMGASQTGSRALVGRLTPPERTAEFFGLWGLAVRVSAIVGPLSYGTITAFTSGDHRRALLSQLVFFILGLALVLTVDERRGTVAASTATARS